MMMIVFQWLHYLTLKLLTAKRLRDPAVSRKSKSLASSAAFSEQDCHECLHELERTLSETVAAYRPQPTLKKGRRKTQAPSHSSADSI